VFEGAVVWVLCECRQRGTFVDFRGRDIWVLYFAARKVVL
jgi:hypothetical protein